MLNHKPHAPLRLRVQDMQRSDRQEILGRLLLEQQATNNGPVTVSYHQRKVVGGSYPSYGGNAVLDMRTLLCERALLTLPDKGVAPKANTVSFLKLFTSFLVGPDVTYPCYPCYPWPSRPWSAKNPRTTPATPGDSSSSNS